MTLNDPELTEIIKRGTPVEIQGNQFIVESQRSGSCDDCYFQSKRACPKEATKLCTSNGGNILKIKEPFNK